MVFLMNTGEAARELHWQRDKAAPMKVEVVSDDQLAEEYGRVNKRSKLSSPLLGGVGSTDFIVPPAQYNPLDEPSPLGLSLRKSPSLLDLIQMRLSQGKVVPKVGKREQRGSSSTTEKLKASNFPASVLTIGSWEYKSRYEGDLVAKCYFAKHKLVWEVLDGGLKNKIEIQWSDIMWLKAIYPDDGPGTLDVVLARQPLFFRETNPQPRKHTLWQATSDFTGGQASVCRRHFLQCPQGLLGRHFEKLIQCDSRLNVLSQQAEIQLDSPYFESKRPSMSIFEDPGESVTTTGSENPTFLTDLCDTNSPSGASSRSEQDPFHQSLESFRHEAPSPCSVTDTRAIDDIKSRGVEEWTGLSFGVPGLHPSMSMSDLVTHLEQRVSEQNPASFLNEERHSLEILEEMKQFLFSDTQPPSSDENSLICRVNSLCSLLQKDPPAGDTFHLHNDRAATMGDNKPEEGEDQTRSSLTRKDSDGDLLHGLPRVASMPQFLFNVAEDSDYPRAR
ncbi:hypothetical protein DM860_010211 [Cuscuta australis]|uniref:TRF2/HOY1 PH-like domain-containing protein n=1 Tax=Cuscuta australis TaxID=267555 RepID=A0A328D6I0_9ASTE|nr:hypothetical protein DM860_010211 [Cuscuta australis]